MPHYLQTAPVGNTLLATGLLAGRARQPAGQPARCGRGGLQRRRRPGSGDGRVRPQLRGLAAERRQRRFPQTPIEIPLAPAGRPPAEPRGFGRSPCWPATSIGSGRPDLAVVNNLSSNVAILLDFDGTSFASEQYVTVGTLPNAIASGDLDGDGDLDLVVTNECDNTVSILRNDGQGVSRPTPPRRRWATIRSASPPATSTRTAAWTWPWPITGRTRKAATWATCACCWPTAAAGSFRTRRCAVGFGPAALVAADLDGDGHLDLAVANFLSDNVTVCRGSGDGTFTAAATLPGGSGPMDIDAADLEGDGDLDLLVTNGKSKKVGILRNRLSQGVFEFEPAESFGAANFPGASQISLAVGDLDGNGTVDLALANSQENSVAVHLNTLVGGTHRVALTGTETVTGLDFGLQPLDTTLKVASLTATRTRLRGPVQPGPGGQRAEPVRPGRRAGAGGCDGRRAPRSGPVRGSLVVDPGLRQGDLHQDGRRAGAGHVHGHAGQRRQRLPRYGRQSAGRQRRWDRGRQLHGHVRGAVAGGRERHGQPAGFRPRLRPAGESAGQ